MKKISKLSVLAVVALTLMCCVGMIIVAISQRAQPAKAGQVKVESDVKPFTGECTLTKQPGIKLCPDKSLVSFRIQAVKKK